MSFDSMYKTVVKLQDYFSSRDSSPLALATYISGMPDDFQEQIFEFALAFIQAVAEDGAPPAPGYTHMNEYRDLAEKIVEYARSIGRL